MNSSESLRLALKEIHALLRSSPKPDLEEILEIIRRVLCEGQV